MIAFTHSQVCLNLFNFYINLSVKHFEFYIQIFFRVVFSLDLYIGAHKHTHTNSHSLSLTHTHTDTHTDIFIYIYIYIYIYCCNKRKYFHS